MSPIDIGMELLNKQIDRHVAEKRGLKSEIARLTKANAELREALDGVPCWEAGYNVNVCLGCGVKWPIAGALVPHSAHFLPCWAADIAKALANSSEGE